MVYTALVLDNILLTVVGEISFNPALSLETKRGFSLPYRPWVARAAKNKLDAIINAFPHSANSSGLPVLVGALGVGLELGVGQLHLEDSAKDQLHPTWTCYQEIHFRNDRHALESKQLKCHNLKLRRQRMKKKRQLLSGSTCQRVTYRRTSSKRMER